MTASIDRRRRKPARRGDFVTTADGVYGLVMDERHDDRRLVCLLVQEDGDEDPYEVWVPAVSCTPEHSIHGSYELCDAIWDGQPCQAWAARSVTLVPVDACGRELCDADGYALLGLEPARVAICWAHLPAAVFAAAGWYGDGVAVEVRLSEVAGGSSARPAGVDKLDFGPEWYVTDTAATGSRLVGGRS